MNMMYSKVSSKCQTVIPREIREKLSLAPGDRLAYTMTEKGIVIKKVTFAGEDDPFAVFSEWSSASDDAAYADL